MQFFLYFANNAGGIGVLISDSPVGPFADPIGKALVTRATPGCEGVTWMFDPAVLVDDDGIGYLYFGGGIPEGQQAAPKTARVMQLGDDMISVVGTAEMIDAPYLFEDSGINKINGRYVYSYCTNFQVPSAQEAALGFASGEICARVSDNPMGPFTYSSSVLKNPSHFYGIGGNNHHCMFEFMGQWYIAYHTQVFERRMGISGGYRSTGIDLLTVSADGALSASMSMAGVPQLKPVDPYQLQQAAMVATLAGCGIADGAAVSTAEGGWFAISGVDFGETGAGAVTLTARGSGAVAVVLDDVHNVPVATIQQQEGEAYSSVTAALQQKITGIHDLYLVFEADGDAVACWQFENVEGEAESTDGKE